MTFEYVPSHSGEPGNHEADRLAHAGASRYRWNKKKSLILQVFYGLLITSSMYSSIFYVLVVKNDVSNENVCEHLYSSIH